MTPERGDHIAGYVPGAVLLEPGYTTTVLDPDAGFGPVTLLIWSVGGRRTGLVTADQAPERVVFAANTSFAVLRVRRDAGTVLVLLCELPGTARAEDDDAVLDRLQRAAAGLVHSGQSAAADPERYRGPVGLDESGHPFALT